MSNLINWSEVSRLLTGDRVQIRADYNGKKYKEVTTDIKKQEKLINDRIEEFKKENK